MLGSTPEQVNGPHPQKAHADEIELMREDTWRESRNMTMSGKTKDGRTITPQDICTSTRKGPSGRVQLLIDEITSAVREGFVPPRKLYMWCQKETAHERPNCQCVEKEDREARLEVYRQEGWDLPEGGPALPGSTCNCDRIRSGKWMDGDHEGKDRLLTQICQGDFFKSRGWQPPADINKQFTENDQETYEAQVLCQRPEMKFHYLPNFSEEKHGLTDYDPNPDNGPIFQSVDWGGTNPHAVHWYQLLDKDIETPNFYGEMTRVREGTLICFDEIYIAEIGNEELGNMVLKRELEWRTYFKAQGHHGWWVYERFADPQGKAAKLDWKAKGLKTSWHTTREKEEHFKAIRQMFSNDLFRVDVRRCQKWVWEAKDWRKDEVTGLEIDERNHAMSDFRYAVANVKRIKAKALARHTPSSKRYKRRAPQVTVRDSRRPAGPVGFRSNQPENEFDRWKKSLGEPVSRP